MFGRGTSREKIVGGWACNKIHGHKHGHKHVGPFRKDVEEMFVQGIEDVSKRLGPGRMASVLKKRQPGRSDLPSENETRQATSTLSEKQRKGEDPTLSSNRRAMIEPFLSTIQDIIKNIQR